MHCCSSSFCIPASPELQSAVVYTSSLVSIIVVVGIVLRALFTSSNALSGDNSVSLGLDGQFFHVFFYFVAILGMLVDNFHFLTCWMHNPFIFLHHLSRKFNKFRLNPSPVTQFESMLKSFFSILKH